MSLAKLSIRRPIFVSCLFLVILVLGIISYHRLTIELYPDVNFPVVNVTLPFPGAAPEEIENQISKPVENALSSIAGIRSIRSHSIQGAGIITAIFSMEADARFVEQKVNQAIGKIQDELPSGVMEPSLKTINPSDVPIMTFALTADLSEGKLFELADKEIRPLFEQINQVALVELQGERKREIQVEVDRIQLANYQMSISEVAQRLETSGLNIPSGEIRGAQQITPVRSVGQFDTFYKLKKAPIRFAGNEIKISLGQIASIKDGLTDEKNRVYVNGRTALVLKVYRQTGGDMLKIAQQLRKQVTQINLEFQPKYRNFDFAIAHDGTKPIQAGVQEAKLSIEMGVLLTILVVFFFLGNLRSTLITGIALPNSLFGAFLLMWLAGFSINITTLAALSLAVGLLIDDSIVVRESVFRRIEKGEPATTAAIQGTEDVTLAVIATTFTVLAVFGPIAFLRGIIGQFFKEFGLTLCFAMLISLLDSLTMAPMLSAYFAGRQSTFKDKSKTNKKIKYRLDSINHLFLDPLLKGFTHFQDRQVQFYLKVLDSSLKHPLWILSLAALIFGMSFIALNSIPKSFVPPAGAGEFQVSLNVSPGTSLQATDEISKKIDQTIRSHPEVETTLLTIGGENGESNQANIIVLLKDYKLRKASTQDMKERVRQDLEAYTTVHSIVQEVLDFGGGAGQPFVVNISGPNLTQLKEVSFNLVEELKKLGDLKDLDTSYRPGASEFKIVLDPIQAEKLGVSSAEAGQELRLFLAGKSVGKFHDQSEQYDIHIRLKQDQMDLKKDFKKILVPNLNHRMIPLSNVATSVYAESPSIIRRENRKRIIEISADLHPKGQGLAHAIQSTQDLLTHGKLKLPPGVSYEFTGQSRDFQELLSNVTLALGISIGFMYLVLASLYESFFTPLTIMLVLPLSICGAFYALALTHTSLEINSMMGCILLLGVAAKNSILLVDHIQKGIKLGQPMQTAILDAGKVRFRPIMMTSFALIAGMLPVAIPLEEAAKQRAGMAIAVIGGLVTSTLLTLVVVPASYKYIQSFQDWVLNLGQSEKGEK